MKVRFLRSGESALVSAPPELCTMPLRESGKLADNSLCELAFGAVFSVGTPSSPEEKVDDPSSAADEVADVPGEPEAEDGDDG